MSHLSAHFDVILVGAGGMGSAAAFHLARRGRRVMAIDAFSPPHDMGSSHGLTRIIRLAYHEDPSYVPLLRRAYALWRELEVLSGERLLTITGSLEIGPPGGAMVTGALASCRQHDLAYEVLTAAEIKARFPAHHLPAGYVGVLQPEGGFLDPERCIAAHHALAQALGAELRSGERVVAWEPDGDGVMVRTDRGVYRAERLILTPGAWLPKLVPQFAGIAIPERQVLGWFRPTRPELFAAPVFPVFLLEAEEGLFYGFPIHGLPGLKVARHHHFREVVDPDAFERTPQPADQALLAEFVARYLPAGAGEPLKLMTCLYTNTPDEHFIIDTLPQHPQVLVCGGFSGHGFKFCSLVGEIVADLVTADRTDHCISLFRMGRFSRLR